MSSNTRRQKLCKICQLDKERREAIEKEGNKKGKTWTRIADNFNINNTDIQLSRHVVANHCTKHVFKVTEKIINFPDGTNADEEETLSKTEIQSLTDFLDLVVEKVNDGVKSGNLQPTVQEGVKAAEIKAKIKEDSKFEKELISFFTQVSRAHGYSN